MKKLFSIILLGGLFMANAAAKTLVVRKFLQPRKFSSAQEQWQALSGQTHYRFCKA